MFGKFCLGDLEDAGVEHRPGVPLRDRAAFADLLHPLIGQPGGIRQHIHGQGGFSRDGLGVFGIHMRQVGLERWKGAVDLLVEVGKPAGAAARPFL